jgi:hypothetical protein
MTGRPDLTFAELTAEKYPHLFEFYADALPAADRTRALYEWRLRDVYASGGIRTIIARSGPRIVAATSIVPLRLGLQGSSIQAAWQQDTVVKNTYRGLGIGRKLVNLSAEGLPLVTSKGTLPAMYALKKGMGFHDVPRSNYLLRVLSPISTSGSLRKRLALPLLHVVAQLRAADHRSSALRTFLVSQFDTDFDSLCERITAGGEVTPVKNSRYLNWRYRECPVRSYLIIRTEDGDGHLRGAAVIRPNAEPYHDAWLVDMIVEINDREAHHALLNASFVELRRRKAACVRTFATSPTIRRSLADRAFLETADTPRFTYRFAEPLPDFQAASWNFWHGDGDTELLG